MTPDTARTILGLVRLVNGLAGLMMPRAMARRFGVDPDVNRAAVYVLRLFGIRTVLLGVELLVVREANDRRVALQTGVLVHASDATAAVIAGIHEQLPRGAAIAGALISAANTGLALAALRDRASAPSGAPGPS